MEANATVTMRRALRPAGDRIRLQRDGHNSWLPESRRLTLYDSGTSALAAALTTFVTGAKRNVPEVLMPAYACPDLLAATQHVGARARMVDLEPNRPWMDLAALEASITASTVAVIAVNFLGIPERIEQLRGILSRYNVPLVYDCAQSFADGISTTADTVILSFGRGKPVSLLGGGAVLRTREAAPTVAPSPDNSAEWTFRLKARLYNLLAHPHLYWIPQALPWLELGATRYEPLGHIHGAPPWLGAYINPNTHAQRQPAPEMHQRLHAFLDRLGNTHYLDLPALCGAPPEQRLLRYPVLCSTPKLRERTVAHLQKAGLGASVLYARPLPEVEGVSEDMFTGNAEAPNARSFGQRLVTLPTHEDVAPADVDAMERIMARVTREQDTSDG